MPDPPSGTVTFLFTDIEGSTRRWERDAAATRAAVEAHFAVLRDAIEANGGVLFKTVGDAVQAAFPTGPAALRAAIAAQRAFVAEAPAPGDSLAVRMALHTGEAAPRDGDYFAPCLNRLSRLLSTGHGRQILLSQATQQLVRDSLPPDVSLLRLGEHRLRDLADADEVFQVVAPGLPSDFPPLKSLDRPSHNLPLQLTPFVGREREIAEARRRLRSDGERLLTLTGPGGSGKTRLALEIAAGLVDAYPDGVWFVPLAAVADPDLVVPAVAAAVGLRETAGQPVADLLTEHLRQKRLLLVLDNFEQVVAAAPACAALLANCPGLALLVTSRTPLHVAGEHELPVPPLDLPPAEAAPRVDALLASAAIRLFVDRARAVRPDFALTPDNAAAVAEICRQLDGLPLALELAAARLKLLPPEAMLPRLGKRLALLTAGGRDRPERHQTLRDAIAWSFDLLAPPEQRLFARLAAFAGSWSLEAVEAVADALDGDGFAVVEELGALVDMSLVRPAEPGVGGDPSPRFAMLRTIQEFAAERLAAGGEQSVVRSAHADRYLDVAEAAAPCLTGADSLEMLNRLEAEHDNLRAALAWLVQAGDGERAVRLAGSLWRFWWVRGYVSEGRKHLETALAAGTGGPPTAARAAALDGAGVLAEIQGDYDRARDLHERALAASSDLGDLAGVARARGNLGVVALDHGDVAGALPLLEAALAESRQAGQPATVATILNDLGWAAYGAGDLARAESLLRESLALRRDLGDQSEIARALNNLGAIEFELGDFRQAGALFAESLAHYESTGDRWGQAAPLNSLGETARAAGDLDRAIDQYERSLALFRALGDARNVAVVALNLANAARARGDLDGAEAAYREALRRGQEVGDEALAAACLAGLGGVARDRARAEPAARLLGAAAGLVAPNVLEAGSSDAPRYPEDAAALKAEMGEAAFGAAWAAGRALPLEAAVRESGAPDNALGGRRLHGYGGPPAGAWE